MIEIREIFPSDKRLFRKFVDFPNKLYKNCTHYVPCLFSDEINLLNPEKNVSFEECKARYFLAYKDGVIAGRICGLIQLKSNEIHNEKAMRFSRFDAIDDAEVFRALLAAVEKYAEEEGMELVHGPYGFNDMDREGYLFDGFDLDATFATYYNYPYYRKHFNEAGYTQENEWLEYRITIPDEVPEKVERVAQIAEKRYGLKVLNGLPKKELKEKWMHAILDCYDECYSVLPGTVPLSPKLRSQLADQFLLVINTRYLTLVVNEENEVAAFGLSFPTISKFLHKSGGRLYPGVLLKILREVKHPTGLELGIVGCREKYRMSGALAMILRQNIIELKKDGIREVESNPELVFNSNILNLWNPFERKLVRHRETVKKELK